MKIELLERGIDVGGLQSALAAHPDLWNQHQARTADPASPHHGLDDIWLRFAPQARLTDGPPQSQWYPSAYALRAAIPAVEAIFERYGGQALGGVLMTRIPAGRSCRPHIDQGWHARAYEKFALQIHAAPGQRFCFEGETLETAPGDLFWFDNQYLHWVENPTAQDRVTMIICLKR
jgi:hypothetical protein